MFVRSRPVARRHGVDQPRNPWFDGPEYITQCPIRPGANFTYRIFFSEEEGTLWWHAHSDFDGATVHGAIVIHPKRHHHHPYPKPHGEIPVILGEWWNEDVEKLLEEAKRTGGDFKLSEANTINVPRPIVGELEHCRDLACTPSFIVKDGKAPMLK
jgi:laccase